jgi:pathogenicity locus Cdd1 protein
LDDGKTVSAERREAVAGLQEIPNIGPVMARDLVRIGVLCLEDLVGKDPDEMYNELCAVDGVGHDPCVRDVFAAAVACANGEPARPWWAFTPERKARDRDARGAR